MGTRRARAQSQKGARPAGCGGVGGGWEATSAARRLGEEAMKQAAKLPTKGFGFAEINESGRRPLREILNISSEYVIRLSPVGRIERRADRGGGGGATLPRTV